MNEHKQNCNFKQIILEVSKGTWSTGEDELYDTVSVDEDNIRFGNGFGDFPDLPFYFCPVCGVQLQETEEEIEARKPKPIINMIYISSNYLSIVDELEIPKNSFIVRVTQKDSVMVFEYSASILEVDISFEANEAIEKTISEIKTKAERIFTFDINNEQIYSDIIFVHCDKNSNLNKLAKWNEVFLEKTDKLYSIYVHDDGIVEVKSISSKNKIEETHDAFSNISEIVIDFN